MIVIRVKPFFIPLLVNFCRHNKSKENKIYYLIISSKSTKSLNLIENIITPD